MVPLVFIPPYVVTLKEQK